MGTQRVPAQDAARGNGKSIRSDGALREKLALASQLRIAPRRLDGWEPRTVTEPEYDPDTGVLLRSVEHREPEFDDEQVAWMLAYARHSSDIGAHGQLISEATDPRADPNDYEGGYRYVVDPPITDWAEKQRLDDIEAWKVAAGENANLNGLIFRVRRVDG